MKTYEFMVVLRPDYPVEDEKAIKTFISKLTAGASVEEFTLMGKKQLAYPIKKMGVAGKQIEGVYALATLKSNRITVGAIEKEVAMGNDVLRYLLTEKKGKAN